MVIYVRYSFFFLNKDAKIIQWEENSLDYKRMDIHVLKNEFGPIMHIISKN